MGASRRPPAPLLLLLLLSLCLCLLLLAPRLTSAEEGSGKAKYVRRPKVGVGGKLSLKDLEAIEDQWMEDEVEDEDDTPFKFTKTPDGGRMPPSPNGPKTEMGFVTVNAGSRKKTDQLAGMWGDQMAAAGIDVKGYTIEDNRILFVADQRGFKDMSRVRTFLLRQPETVEFEWNQKKVKPGDVPVDDVTDEGDVTSDPLANFNAMQEEQMRKEKREKRRKEKEAEAQRRARDKEKKKRAALAKKKKEEKEKKAQAAKEAKAAKAAKESPATQAKEAEIQAKTEIKTELKTEL